MADRYQYGADYLGNLSTFVQRVRNKTIVPYQVEWQPGPPPAKICWLECPYCYGGSATFVPDRLALGRALEVLDDVVRGGVRKLIFAGYATDPLFSPDLLALVTRAVQLGVVVGFNTKALAVAPGLLRVLEGAAPESYVSVSVDAGSDAVYKAVHGVARGNADLYARVMTNLCRLAERGIEVAATYLVNQLNATEVEIERFLGDAVGAGVAVVRFAFAQEPREAAGSMPTVPTEEERTRFAQLVTPIVARWQSAKCRVLLVDPDMEHGLAGRARTLPCVARFVYPTVGYDGWLYPCSQTGAPNFRALALGNLRVQNFWDCYYNYDPEDRGDEFNAMEACGCRCDRKEHLVNLQAQALVPSMAHGG